MRRGTALQLVAFTRVASLPSKVRKIRALAHYLIHNSGAVESLSREILPLGIRTHLIVLGQFRTSILNPSRLQSSTSTTVKDYEAIRGEVSTRHTSTNERQIGDPALAVERIIDLVEQKGVFAELDKLPLRVLLGSDAVEVVRTKCLETLAIVSDMEAVSQSTDFPDAESVPSYWDAPK